jgi:hypothetical protein
MASIIAPQSTISSFPIPHYGEVLTAYENPTKSKEIG